MLLPYLNKDVIEAGCDEAGRGCLAGAVYAAAVILPSDFRNEMLNDSKQLTERQRYLLREVIEKEAVAWAVGVVTPEEIDKLLQACPTDTGRLVVLLGADAGLRRGEMSNLKWEDVDFANNQLYIAQ